MRRNQNPNWAQIVEEVDADIAAGRTPTRGCTWLDSWTDPVAYSQMAAEWEIGELEGRLKDVPIETVVRWLYETAEITRSMGLSAAVRHLVDRMYPLQAKDESTGSVVT